MDQIKSLGTNIAEIVPPTMKAYVPLIKANASDIQSTKREEFAYGTHERQQLDVYYPPNYSSKSPCLIFMHGGGLVAGGKTIFLPTGQALADGLVHANLGHFFASKHGFVTVVPNYRLLRHDAKFPSGGEDYSLVVEWASKNLTAEGPRDLFVIGHSAGGIHLSTLLFEPTFEKTVQRVVKEDSKLPLKGIVLLSVPFDYKNAPSTRSDNLYAYFGQDLEANSPTTLLAKAKQRNSQPFHNLPVLVVNLELDPDNEINLPLQRWLEVADGINNIDKVRYDGHNHISPPLSLSTGSDKEEEWGNGVAKWCLSKR